ncbi:LysE family translocator [Pseudalkalibacillus berkeleyi]|uniref:LysE family translocator n=1 Tax=Pseudalkalibacillus berkeleyi TaxID=1069813 RepID=A0ABS9H0R3_9BACL|nr:LysE family transporter [Pseudalkalibacillus berkeleyi]MCF6138582.1 LysE family translocator [Pseudalkalibacillus berkeleyi]
MLATVSGYILLGLSIAAPIGPINIEIIKRGLVYGFWAALLVGAGGISSDLALMALMFFGLSQVMTLVWVKISLTMLGCFILIHSGVNNLRVTQDMNRAEEGGDRHGRVKIRSYLSGVTIAASNPMNLLFWLGIYGSVLSGVLQQSNHLQSFFISSLVFIGIALWNLNLAFTVHFGRLLMNASIMKGVNIIASFVLIGFGVKFGWMGVKELVEVVGRN